MGTIFTLDPSIRSVSRTILDDMLNELGKTLRLVYEPIRTECPNCVLSPITKRSSGVYQSGGAASFEEGETCSVCGGEGWLTSSAVTEDIKASVARTPKEWFVAVPPNFVLPAGIIQLKIFAENWSKVKRARSFILSPEASGIEQEVYRLHSALGDPSSLVPGRYAVAFFERV